MKDGLIRCGDTEPDSSYILCRLRVQAVKTWMELLTPRLLRFR